MPVYKFSHHLLAVLVHLAHTAVKWKTNFLTLDVGDKLVNTDDTALMKYEKKFMQKAVSIMYTVFSFKKEHGRCLHLPQVALASVDIFHAVAATGEHVRHG